MSNKRKIVWKSKQPSYDELADSCLRLDAALKEAKSRIAELEFRIGGLEK